MIYVGYQGIGKTTLSHSIDYCIDLESGNFFISGFRHEDWYKVYANIAQSLSNQGKIVFTSSHKMLRDYMRKRKIPFTVIYPSLELKEYWIAKLKERYEATGTNKDFKAWVNAAEKYDENINDLSKEKNKIVIQNFYYDLKELVIPKPAKGGEK